MEALKLGLLEGVALAAPYAAALVAGLFIERCRQAKALRLYERQRRNYTKKRLEKVHRCEI